VNLYATGYSQNVQLNLSLDNVKLSKVFEVIQAQTQYQFIYNDENVNKAPLVSLSVREATVPKVLELCFKNSSLTYRIVKDVVVVLPKENAPPRLNYTVPFLSPQFIVRGKVTNKDGDPLIGVSITAIRMRTGTTTDDHGNYTLALPSADDTLLFSIIGYKKQEVPIRGDSLINLAMQVSISSLNQLVVTGYEKELKKDLTGAVSIVDVNAIKNIPAGNPLKAMQGRVPGVYIQTDGFPMGGATVRIRGVGTLGNNDPLYVIDGIPTEDPLGIFNPSDIESIQVLKDASSATIYGSRAGNGVIIITTKHAKTGTHINVSSSLSLQRYNGRSTVLNTIQRGKVYWQAAINSGIDPNSTNIYQFDWADNNGKPVLNKVILPDFIDVDKTMKPANTDWWKEMTQTSVIQKTNVTLSNGGEKGSALLSLNYYNNKGIVKSTFQNKFNIRLNSDYSFFNKRLTVGENFAADYIKGSTVNPGDILFAAEVEEPIVPVHTVDGGWGGPASGMTDRQNPMRLIADNRQNKVNTVSIFGNVYANLEIIPHLTLRTSLGVDGGLLYQRLLQKSYVSGFLNDPSNQVNTTENNNINISWQNTLTYKLNVARNDFTFLLGQAELYSAYGNFWASRRGYALETIDYGYLDAGTTNKDNGGSGGGYSLLSYFGKVNYSLDSKYLASVTVRRDGSSRFGQGNRFGVFPAFSLGWRLSQENFIKKSLPVISDLKLRFGWGQTGNQSIADNATYTIYSAIYGTDPTWGYEQGSAYDITGAGSGQLPSGYTRLQQGNESLKWETTTESNWGIDFGFFQNKLSGSLDYFIKKTTDILIRPPKPAVEGQGASEWVNGASMENKGWEFLLSYEADISPDISFQATGNIATYRNKVVYLPDDVLSAYPGNGLDKTILGHPINSYFGYVTDGLFTSQNEIDNAATQVGEGLGRIRYEDLSNDGKIDIDDQDYIGVADPKFTYGLNLSLTYKNLDFSCFFQGVQGNDVYNGNKVYTDFASIWPGVNWGLRTLDAWSADNPKSTIPALTLIDNNNESRSSTYFVEKGSYFKLRNVEIGYDLSKALKVKRIQSARVYFQGNNIFRVKSKSFSGPDPETPNNGYPIPTVYTLGLNLSIY